MFVTDSYANHIFVVYMTFTLKQLMNEQNNVKHLRYMAETLSQAYQVTQIQRITYAFQQ